LLDPDWVLKTKLVEFVRRGDFGLASGPKPEGGYERLRYAQPVPAEEIAFESGVVLLKKAKAEELRTKPAQTPDITTGLEPAPVVTPGEAETGAGETGTGVEPPAAASKTVRLTGKVQPERR
jgi:hypothetical protein